MNTLTVDTKSLVYSNEKSLFIIHCIISGIFWAALIAGTKGIALAFLPIAYLSYLFAQSAVISWIKGNGVKLTAEQLPELYKAYTECCQKLDITTPPDAYLMNGGGILNAFATRFLGRNFVVFYSSIIDAMADKPDAINFYMGHELGHIKRKHIQWHTFIMPSTILPIIGAAYSRACESTCDQFGRACCKDNETALRGLLALAAGEKKWANVKEE